MRYWIVGIAVAALAFSAAFAQNTQAVPGYSDQSSGYLSAAEAPDLLKILPPAPKPGTARYEADRKIFQRTRKLKDTSRWAMALNDDNYSDEAVAKDYSCALGVAFNATDEPHLIRLIARMGADLAHAGSAAKKFYQRKRPFLIGKGATCIVVTPDFAKSYDYPSGHSTYSWALGLVLAELAPDRATQILARARAYGESRVICGVHNASAIEGGRIVGASVVAALHGSPEFRTDLDAARAELQAARAKAATSGATCDAENALVAQPVY